MGIHLPTDKNGILHVCGGDPDLPDDDGNMTTYSPRMWR